jgi:signal transduction histidine kinase
MLRSRTGPRYGFILPILGLATVLLVAHDVAMSRALEQSYVAVAEDLRNTIPTVLELSELLRHLDDLQAGLGAASAGDGKSRRELSLALDETARHHRDYLQLPASGQERARQQALTVAVGALGASLGPELSSDRPLALATVDFCERQIQAAKREASGLLELNVGEAREREYQTSLGRQRAGRFGLITLGGIVVLIAVLGVLMERWLRAFDRLRKTIATEVDIFSARLAHELGTPLSPALLVLGTIKRERKLEYTSPAAVERAEAGLRRASALAEGFLAFGRAIATDLEQPREVASLERVARYLEWRLQPLLDARQARLQVEMDPDASVVMSEVALATIISAFVQSRLQDLEDASDRIVTVRGRSRLGLAVVTVNDRGPPLSAAALSLIQSPGASGALAQGPEGPGSGDEQSSGSLLALARARHLVEAYGGVLSVQSRAGEGTTFTIRLRASSTASGEVATGAEKAA